MTGASTKYGVNKGDEAPVDASMSGVSCSTDIQKSAL